MDQLGISAESFGKWGGKERRDMWKSRKKLKKNVDHRQQAWNQATHHADDGQQADRTMDRRLCGITRLETYLDTIGGKEWKSHTLVVISVKDTVGMAVTKELAKKVQTSLGCRFDLQGKHWKAYLAVIHRGKVLDEQLSIGNESIEFIRSVEGLEVSVFSSTYGKENVSQILLDGVDYSRNQRGLNLVVYEWDARRVCDAVCFDTHMSGYPCTRRQKAEHSLEVRHSAAYLARRMDELEGAIRDLEDCVKCNAKKEQMVLWQIFERAYGNRTEAQQAFFRSLPKAEGRLRKLQQVGLILLKQFDRICKEHGIVYWLGFGTLLGAVRHGGFIPWDDDTDVCMTRDQLEKFAGVMEHETEFCFFEYIVTDIGNTNMCHQFRLKEMQNRKMEFSLDIFVYDFCDDISAQNIEKQYQLKHEMSKKGWELYWNMQDQPQVREEQLRKLLKTYQQKAYQLTGIQDGTQGRGLMWALDNFDYESAKGSCMEVDAVFPLELAEFEMHRFPVPKHPLRYLEQMYGDIYSLPDDLTSHQHFNLDAYKEIEAVLKRYPIKQQPSEEG